ncbi:MAG TPA: hypothetical protein PK830_01900 [Candidatus Atribacteria bacterium]|nr:hypothetical protein [Candidatus Atribacteria bacterium]HPT77845.1 hypothetical protein [Candidatus Atribacteria bacterium]
MKLSKRELGLLVLLLVFAVGALYYTQFYTPMSKQLTDLASKSQNLTIQITDAKSRISKIPDVESQINELENEFDNLKEKFLDGWDEPVLMVYLEDLIGDLAEKTTIYFDRNSPDKLYNSGTIRISLNTSYQNFKSVISKLENGLLYNVPSSVSLDYSDDSDKSLKADLILKFYTLNEPDPFKDDYEFMKGQYGKENIFR